MYIQIEIIDQAKNASKMAQKLVQARASMVQQTLEQNSSCQGRVRCVGRLQSKANNLEQPRVVLKITKA